MPEYRPVPDGRVNDYLQLVSYAFRPENPHEPVESVDDLPAPATLAERRGLFDDGELCSACAHHWFTLDIRGEPHAVAGLSAVSTPPGRRRQGLVGELLAASLAEYRDRDIGFTALWPFAHEFYGRFGWGLANRFAWTTCPPDALAFAEGGEGHFVDLGPDRWRGLAQVYEAHNDHALAMHRTEAWWRKRVFTSWGDDPYVVGWERDGDLRGYLVYTVEKEEGDRRLDVSELGGVDHEARRNVLRLVRNHDSQVETVRIYGTPGTTLFDRSATPGDIEETVQAGPMVRLVDVAGALATLSYPATGEVVLDVSDSLADWNDGRVRLAVGDEEVTCEPTDATADAEVDVGTLSRLAVGSLAVEAARRFGGLVTGDETARTLDSLFPPGEPFLREFF